MRQLSAIGTIKVGLKTEKTHNAEALKPRLAALKFAKQATDSVIEVETPAGTYWGF